MIENLSNLVKENANEAIINNSAIPNERNDEVVREATTAIESSLKSSLSGGNVKEVANLFNGNGENVTNSPVAQQAVGSFTERLQSMFGLNIMQSASIANNLIPNIFKKLVQKTNDPSDSSFSIQSVFDELSGGKTSGMNVQSMMTKFKSGLDKDNDGDLDLQDLKAFFTGSGGVVDKVKGLFK